MAGNYNRIQVESPGNVITSSNYNAEHDNHINNNTPAGVDDYSTNVAEMRAATDPGESGSESLATSLAGELERLRHALNEIKGSTYWYESPSTNLAIISGTERNMHIGLEFEGKYGGASSTTDVLAKLINQGAIINAASYSSADVTTSDFGTTNVKFGTYSYSMASGNILAFPGHHGNPFKGTLSLWYRNAAASTYLAYNPLLGISVYLDNTGLLTFDVQEAAAASETTKAITQVQGGSSRAGNSTFNNVIAKWRLNDEGGASTDLMSLLFNNADEGTQVSADDININPGHGGVWFFGSGPNNPAWDHYSAMSVLPNNEAVDAWTANGTTGSNTVSNGVLTITGQTGTQTNNYSNTNNIDLTQFRLDFKMRRTDTTAVATAADVCTVRVNDTAIDRSIDIAFYPTRVMLSDASEGKVEIFLDVSQFHTYTLVSSGSPDPTVTFYIDGVVVATFDLENTDTTATAISFGDFTSTSGYNSTSEWEYIRWFDAGATAPISAATQGELDSIGIVSAVTADATDSALQSAAATGVFQKTPGYGPTLPYTTMYDRTANNIATISATSSYVDLGVMRYYVAGDGVTEFTFDACIASEANGATGNTELIIDIDNDHNGQTGDGDYGGALYEMSAANDSITLPVKRSIILTPGLHEARVNIRNGTDDMQIVEENNLFQVAIRKLEEI